MSSRNPAQEHADYLAELVATGQPPDPTDRRYRDLRRDLLLMAAPSAPHLGRAGRRTGPPPLPSRRCQFPGCPRATDPDSKHNRSLNALGYCRTHDTAMRRSGWSASDDQFIEAIKREQQRP